MASLKLEHVKKVYDKNVVAVHDFNLEIKDKEFIVFVGPSGCGKSTTLRMIAGLEDISEGTLTIGNRVVNDVEPKDRDIAMVFQNYFTRFCAGGVLVAVPITALFMALQKYYVEGVTGGAVKG